MTTKYSLDIYLTPAVLINGEYKEICDSFNGDSSDSETPYDCFYFDTYDEYVQLTSVFTNTYEDKFYMSASNLLPNQIPSLVDCIFKDYDWYKDVLTEFNITEEYLRTNLVFMVDGYLKTNDEDCKYTNFNEI